MNKTKVHEEYTENMTTFRAVTFYNCGNDIRESHVSVALWSCAVYNVRDHMLRSWCLLQCCRLQSCSNMLCLDKQSYFGFGFPKSLEESNTLNSFPNLNFSVYEQVYYFGQIFFSIHRADVKWFSTMILLASFPEVILVLNLGLQPDTEGWAVSPKTHHRSKSKQQNCSSSLGGI